ncbi:glycosyltransferase [Paenibacillus sp. H1-7]|uniref:tetratricopeptide repeat-containing glycosyltransferase n=1 Tax=Paenibacillus sp. H1-7 TaxID=2282849 RepID=UPI001EF9409F|nr:glycosyltransferase [Paenibacillus sp. H1-7]
MSNDANERFQAIAASLQKQQYFQAEQQAKEYIQTRPLDAQGWAYLGEALLSRGFAGAARAVFERAQLLDPEAAWMPNILKQLEQQEEGTERYDIELLLNTEKVRVSAAMLVRNGEEYIDDCIRSLQGAVDEIVVLDYGSTDRTRTIVAGMPHIKLIQSQWNDSFASLRNEVHAHITGDWVLWLEANERLHPRYKGKVREAAALFQQSESPAALDVISTVRASGGAGIEKFVGPRMYAMKWGLVYSGRVKEKLTYLSGITNGVTLLQRRLNLKLVVTESGSRENAERLSQLHLELLQRMLTEEPDNPVWPMHYGEALAGLGRLEEAQSYAEQAARLAELTDFSHRLELMILTIRLNMELSRWQEAEQAIQEGMAAFPGYPDFSYYSSQLQLHRAQLLYKQAAQNTRLAQEGFVTYRGPDSMDHDIADWKSQQLYAELALSSGELAAAESMYEALAERFPESAEIRTRLARIERQRSKLAGTEGGRDNESDNAAP